MKMDFLKPATGWYFANRCRYNYSDFVSTQSPGFADFSISPNPATTSITLKGADFAHIALFDLQGRRLRSQRLHGEPEETFQLGNLPSGNYLLQVIGSDGKMGAKPLQISH